MATVAKAASQSLLGMFFGAGEHGFIDLAVGIFGHDRASGAIGSYRTATVTNGEIPAGQTVFVFNQMLWPLDEIPSCSACFQHPREVGLAEDITEEVFRIAGDPAVALRNRPFGVYRNELIRTVLFPDAG